jgi:hypothetical protein
LPAAGTSQVMVLIIDSSAIIYIDRKTQFFQSISKLPLKLTYNTKLPLEIFYEQKSGASVCLVMVAIIKSSAIRTPVFDKFKIDLHS